MDAQASLVRTGIHPILVPACSDRDSDSEGEGAVEIDPLPCRPPQRGSRLGLGKARSSVDLLASRKPQLCRREQMNKLRQARSSIVLLATEDKQRAAEGGADLDLTTSMLHAKLDLVKARSQQRLACVASSAQHDALLQAAAGVEPWGAAAADEWGLGACAAALALV